MNVVVTVGNCLDCPLYLEGDLHPDQCSHPKAPRKVVTSHQRLPEGCPLRKGDYSLSASQKVEGA